MSDPLYPEGTPLIQSPYPVYYLAKRWTRKAQKQRYKQYLSYIITPTIKSSDEKQAGAS
jgi:hypothetical protein